ncbi:MAG: hypothetical protein ACW99A_03045 [Candidatus Kariarchaeaceae archaeon]
MSLARRGVYRKEDKQVSFFTSTEIHESIKLEAKRKNSTIKDYLVRLHLNAINENSQDNLIAEMHAMIKRLTENQAFLVMPQQVGSKINSADQKNIQTISNNQQESSQSKHVGIPPTDQDQSTLLSQSSTQYSSQSSEHDFDHTRYSNAITYSQKIELYLSGITRTNTYETMRKIFFALYKLKEATHYQINQEIGHTTHNQPRALKRAVEDGVIFVDEPENPKEPYFYRLNPSYL